MKVKGDSNNHPSELLLFVLIKLRNVCYVLARRYMLGKLCSWTISIHDCIITHSCSLACLGITLIALGDLEKGQRRYGSGQYFELIPLVGFVNKNEPRI